VFVANFKREMAILRYHEHVTVSRPVITPTITKEGADEHDESCHDERDFYGD
jgi:hypothetical protein